MDIRFLLILFFKYYSSNFKHVYYKTYINKPNVLLIDGLISFLWSYRGHLWFFLSMKLFYTDLNCKSEINYWNKKKNIINKLK